MSALNSFTISASRRKDLLMIPHIGELYPLNKITLFACLVSGDPSNGLARFYSDVILASLRLATNKHY